MVASVVLGVVFLVAGASKFAAGPSWPDQARALGAPRLLVPVVPWFEMVLGAILVAQVSRRAAAFVAIVVLVVFSALIAGQLARGRHPPCACFGRWSAAPLGAGHLVRNAALLVVAAIALA